MGTREPIMKQIHIITCLVSISGTYTTKNNAYYREMNIAQQIGIRHEILTNVLLSYLFPKQLTLKCIIIILIPIESFGIFP